MGSIPFDYQEQVTKAKGHYPTPPEDVCNERIERIRESLRERKLDGVIMFGDGSDPDQTMHLSGYLHVFNFDYSLLIIPEEADPILLSDQKWYIDEARKMSFIDDIRPMPIRRGSFDGLKQTLSEALEDAGLSTGRIGTQNASLPAKCLDAMREAAPNAEWVDGSGVWMDYVTRPSDYDIEMISRTGGIADEGQATVKEIAKSGVTEREVCISSLNRMATLGAEFLHGAGVDTHINIGSDSRIISNVRPYLYTNNRLDHGQMFWVDLTAQYRGYHIDCDRTFCIGEPSSEQQQIYDVCRQMYDSMKGALEPGVQGKELWDIGHEIAKDAGYGDNVNFVYFGHSTGVTTSVPPFGLEEDSREIRAGSFFNLEPGIFVPGVGSACIENTLHVTENGAEEVNQFSNDLHIV